MKRLSAIVFAAFICATLVGCSGEDSGNTTQQEQTTAAVTELTQPPEESVPETSTVTTTAVVTTSSAEETTASSEPEPAELPEEQEPQNIYAALITAYDNEYLGLPQKDKVYIFSDGEEAAEIDGVLCHSVSCYDEYEGTLYYMCDFYISDDGSAVYRYYENSMQFVKLPASEAYPQLDPTTQSAEEIFANASELYSLFMYNAIECDSESFIEVDGARYYLVLDERFDTMQELLGHLGKYFSEEIINSLMDSNCFRMGEDGRMYYEDRVTGGDPSYIGSEFELTTLSEDMAEFTVYSTFSGEADSTYEKEYSYTVLKQYGVWRFTNFELYWFD